MATESKKFEINVHKPAILSEGSINWHVERPHSIGPIFVFLHDWFLNMMLESFDIKIEGKSVLNVCCGAGPQLEYIVKKGMYGVGIDISNEMCRIAKIRAERHGINYDVVTADAENLPFKDSSFDIGFCYEGLHHVPEPSESILELCRVSKYRVGLIEPIDCLIRKMLNLFGFYMVEITGVEPYRFKRGELIDILSTSGCEDICVKRYLEYNPKKIFQRKWLLPLYKVSFKVINLFMGNFAGNTTITVAKKVR